MTATPQHPPRLHLTDEDRKNIRLCERHQHRPVTPEERYRSLIDAGELLAAIGFRPYDHYELFGGRLSDHVQQLARAALTHFPTPIELLALLERRTPLEEWLGLPPDVLENFRESICKPGPSEKSGDLDNDF